MKHQLDCVRYFHEGARARVETSPTTDVPKDTIDLRVRLLQEELEEYREAAERGDLLHVADALTDLLYVLLGAFVTHGLQDVAQELFDEVHRSNMSKLAEDGLVLRDDGKVMKPDGFSHPDLEPILTRG